MPTKLVLKVFKNEVTGDTPIIRVKQSAFDKLKEIQRATGQPISHIASKMIEFAAENIEIVEE